MQSSDGHGGSDYRSKRTELAFEAGARVLAKTRARQVIERIKAERAGSVGTASALLPDRAASAQGGIAGDGRGREQG